jgi:hypothetical protein
MTAAGDALKAKLRDAITGAIERGEAVAIVGRLACSDCGAHFDDTGIASRGYPPLCGKCFTARIADGR